MGKFGSRWGTPSLESSPDQEALSARGNSSFRSGHPVCLPGISPTVGTLRPGRQHEPKRQLLRQRGHGSVLEYAQARGSGGECQLVQGPRAARNFRIHRIHLQPEQAPQLSGLSITCGLRTPEQLNMKKTALTGVQKKGGRKVPLSRLQFLCASRAVSRRTNAEES